MHPSTTSTPLTWPGEARQAIAQNRQPAARKPYRPRHLHIDDQDTAQISAQKIATALREDPPRVAHAQVAVPLPVREVVTTALRPRVERRAFLAWVRSNVGRFRK